MKPENDDFHIGVPVIGRTTTAPLPGKSALSPDEELELRAGETELGRPRQVPSDLDELSVADRAALAKIDQEQAARDVAEAEMLLASDPSGLGWLGWFGSPLAFALMLGMAGVFGVFLFNQTATLVQTLAALPEAWMRYVGYGGLILFGLCVLYSVIRFAVLYVKLRENRQMRIRGLRELSNRTKLRWLAAMKAAEARQQLEVYLKEYPLETERDSRALAKLGLTPELQNQLRAVRTELLNPDKFASTEQWFTRFRDAYQRVIDEVAEQRIKYWSNRVWVVTAMAPNPVVDSGATLFYTFSMLSELCQLYRVRAGRTGTAVLLGRTFFNAYLAGQGTEWEKLAEEQYDQLFHEAMHAIGVGIHANAIGKLLGKVGAKATTGYLNRILLIRLGRYAVRLLRPVSRD